MGTKHKNSNGDKTKKKNSKYGKTQLVTKLKLWQNSKSDKAQIVTKLKLWQNPNWKQTQIVKEEKNSTLTKLR